MTRDEWRANMLMLGLKEEDPYNIDKDFWTKNRLFDDNDTDSLIMEEWYSPDEVCIVIVGYNPEQDECVCICNSREVCDHYPELDEYDKLGAHSFEVCIERITQIFELSEKLLPLSNTETKDLPDL